MNTLLKITTLFFAILIGLSSCNKDEPSINNNDETSINDNYYVKYVISTTYPRIFSNWSVTTPEGKFTKNNYQTRYWEQTFGPVKKGFYCDVRVENGEPTIEIHIAKNQEPFALKSTGTGSRLSYTINY